MSEISFIPLNKCIPIMEIKMGSYNCRDFNVSKIPAIKELFNDCDVLLIQETWLLPHELNVFSKYLIGYNCYGVLGMNSEVLYHTSVDAIKTLLIENDITVFNAAVVSNELATYKSFKVTIPADQKAAACLPAIWPDGIRVRDFIPCTLNLLVISFSGMNCLTIPMQMTRSCI